MCQGEEKTSGWEFRLFYFTGMLTLLRYCVGLVVSKVHLQVCLSVVDQAGRVSIKATTKVANGPAGFQALLAWVGRHRKLELSLGYVMESTGVYHEALAWYLHQQEQTVSILLPNKAKHYLKSLGYKRSAAAV
jgi:transposase